jgi:hypothetical protein
MSSNSNEISDHEALTRQAVDRELEANDGVLPLKPAWVARDWLPPGRRLGLDDNEYEVAERGFICERWLGSTTRADNRIGPADEGLSYLRIDGSERITLDAAVNLHGAAIMGHEYASAHDGLGRLAKIYDFGARIPYHVHHREQHAKLVGCKSKDEAYYFPEGVEMGVHPETFFGVHPWIAETRSYDALLPYLEDWDSDLILRHARAELNVADEGFHVPSGILHAPGTALTIELQEDSDVLAMLQALNAGKIISKDLMFKDVRNEDRERYGERFILELMDWELNGDPYFYENRHLSPQLANSQPGGREFWIYYNTKKFSGKKLVVAPGQAFTNQENGVYNVLVWQGQGIYAGHEVVGGDHSRDELLIAHDRATQPHQVRNTGTTDLVVIKFFGPDINSDLPMITPRVLT